MTDWQAVVADGATVAVRLADGRVLGPFPVDWFFFGNDLVAFSWIGTESREHIHDVASVTEDDLPALVIETTGGDELRLEPLWSDAHRGYLASWARAVIADPELRYYPEGAWRYGGLPGDVRVQPRGW